MALTGIVTFSASILGLKCTSPKEPGSSLPSLFGTSTSVSKVRVVVSMASAVRATEPRNFSPGNSCNVITASTPSMNGRRISLRNRNIDSQGIGTRDVKQLARAACAGTARIDQRTGIDVAPRDHPIERGVHMLEPFQVLQAV